MKQIKDAAKSMSEITKSILEIWNDNIHTSRKLKEIQEFNMNLYQDIIDINLNFEVYEVTEENIKPMLRILEGIADIKTDINQMQFSNKQDSFVIDNISSKLAEMSCTLSQLKFELTKR